MRRTAVAILITILCAGGAWGDAVELGSVDMVRTSDIIAIVDIGTLTSTDETRRFSNLIADATVEETLKGRATGEISFSIPIFFPCATLEVETGRHLVFLRRHPNGGYFGSNYGNSYVPLGKEKIKWCGPELGSVVEMTPSEIVAETRRLITENHFEGTWDPISREVVASVQDRAAVMVDSLKPGMTRGETDRLLGEPLRFSRQGPFEKEVDSLFAVYYCRTPGQTGVRTIPVHFQETEGGLILREARPPEGAASEDNAEAKVTQEVH